MKQKCLILKGLIASGKSTFAKEFIKQNKNYKKVNREALRFMLSEYEFNNENEILVQKLWEDFVKKILTSGYNLLIDEQNLNSKTRNKNIEFIKKIIPDIEIEIKNFPVDLEEAIKRDSFREFKIGEKVIRQTWNKYKEELIEMINEKSKLIEQNKNLPEAIISDIDGTIAHKSDRNIFDYSRVQEDSYDERVVELLKFYKSQNRTIIIVSGRDDDSMEVTKEWFIKNDVPFDFMYMRKTGDKRRDSIVKKEIYDTYIKGKYNVIAVIDDRPQVLNECWRPLGLFTFDVGRGIDF